MPLQGIFPDGADMDKVVYLVRRGELCYAVRENGEVLKCRIGDTSWVRTTLKASDFEELSSFAIPDRIEGE